MATPPLPDEVLIEAVEAVKNANGVKDRAAIALGINPKTFRHRLKLAAQRGLDGSIPKPLPIGQVVKGTSTLYSKNEAGEWNESLQWVKTKEGERDPLEVAELLKTAFAEYEPAAKPSTPPENPAADLLTVIPCNDWHLGMFAWGKETGENWDLKIAEDTIGRCVEDVILRSPSSAQALILGGGDLLHSDSQRNETTSGTKQDVDGRYQKVLLAASRLMVRTIDAALSRHGHVTVRVLPGNHDTHAAVAVAYFLLAWYRNDPRVTVDVDPSLFFWFRFGSVLIGSTHGHTVKITAMPSIMAHRRAEDWGATKFRYVYGFHLHHSAKIATEGNGVICEIFQAPIPQDAWHFGSGYLSGRSIQAITHHRDYGEIGRVRTAVIDGE